MSFDSAYYTTEHPEITQGGLDAEVYYLTTGWEAGHATDSAGTPLTPDEVLQMIAGTGDDLTDVVAGMDDSQLAFIDQATDFDLGAVLGSLDDSLLAGFMAGWGSDELSFLNDLSTFDLGDCLGDFDPNTLMDMMNGWEDVANLEYLANLEGFEFDTLAGGNPDEMMALIGRMGSEYQTMIYDDFGADDFAWLDGAAGFDLAGMMDSNFDFFQGFMAPEEALGLFGYLGADMTEVVAGFDASDLAFLDGAEGFDLGTVLASLDDSLLAGFMEGWGTEQLGYLDGLASFDLGQCLEGFDPNTLLDMMNGWGDVANLEYLANLDGFEFDTLAGGNPDEMMALIGRMGAEYQTMIYDDFGADDFAWLDGAADFDLAGMMGSNFGFFEGLMAPEEALGLFGYLGADMTEVVAGFDASELAFLDGAEGFDLGAVLGSLDDSLLAGFMAGWGTEQLSYLDGLGSFDLGQELGGFDPEVMGTMLSGWDDPNALGMLGGLEGFDFGGMLDAMPDDMVGDMLGGWDPSMLDQLGEVGGGFDMDGWLADADTFLPPDFDWVPPPSDGDTTMPTFPDGTMPALPDGITYPTAPTDDSIIVPDPPPSPPDMLMASGTVTLLGLSSVDGYLALAA